MENENINTEVVEPQNESEEVKSDSLSSRKQRKYKRLEKIKTKFFDKPDMKYIGPLSYRTLRIIAWICIGLGQFAFLCSIGQKMSMNWSPINDTTSFVFSIISSMSVAFFVIPAFGIILRKPSSYKNYLFVYGGTYLLIGTIFCISYGRYVDGLIRVISDNPASLLSTIENIITNRGSINVFSDLFLFTLFNTFIFHTPKKKCSKERS